MNKQFRYIRTLSSIYILLARWRSSALYIGIVGLGSAWLKMVRNYMFPFDERFIISNFIVHWRNSTFFSRIMYFFTHSFCSVRFFFCNAIYYVPLYAIKIFTTVVISSGFPRSRFFWGNYVMVSHGNVRLPPNSRLKSCYYQPTAAW